MMLMFSASKRHSHKSQVYFNIISRTESIMVININGATALRSSLCSASIWTVIYIQFCSFSVKCTVYKLVLKRFQMNYSLLDRSINYTKIIFAVCELMMRIKSAIWTLLHFSECYSAPKSSSSYRQFYDFK